VKTLVAILGTSLLLVGCARSKEKFPKDQIKPAPTKSKQTNSLPEQISGAVISPDETAFGKILFVNSKVRFVVIGFSSDNLPQTGRRLNVYRNGLKIGEIKVTGPQQGNNIIGDILVGEARENDEVREN
jgi:hypothetical protein